MSFFSSNKELKHELSKLRRHMIALRIGAINLKIKSYKLKNKISKVSIFVFIGFFIFKLYIIIQANIGWFLGLIKLNAAQVGLISAATLSAATTSIIVYKNAAVVIDKDIIDQETQKETKQIEKSKPKIEHKEIKQHIIPKEIDKNDTKTIINSQCKFILIDGTEVEGKFLGIDSQNFKILKNNGQIEKFDQSFVFKIYQK